MTKQRKPRIPKTKRLSDGSIIIDGFIAPAPKHAPPVPARMPPEWESFGKNIGERIMSEALQYSKPVPVFGCFGDIEPIGRNQ